MAQRFQPGALWNSQRQLEPHRGCLWSRELTGQLAKVCSVRSKIELLRARRTSFEAAYLCKRGEVCFGVCDAATNFRRLPWNLSEIRMKRRSFLRRAAASLSAVAVPSEPAGAKSPAAALT